MAMEDFKLILDKEEWDTVVFVDSDTFFENIDYAEKLIKQFNESNFGFCSYLENVFDYKPEYVFSGAIAEVNDQYFEEVDQPPYTFKPIPHYENAFMMIKRKVWDNLRIQCFINTRELVKGIFEAKAKIGIHYRDKKLVYSHKGNGWFHVGALTKYYYMMENGDLSQLDPDSEIDKARIGYFVAQRERYGREIYADHINENVTKAAEIFGGEGIVKLAWVNLSEMLL